MLEFIARAHLGAVGFVKIRLTHGGVAVDFAVRGVDDGAVSRQEAVGRAAFFVLVAGKQGQVGVVGNVPSQARGKIVMLHVGKFDLAVFAARLCHHAVAHAVVFGQYAAVICGNAAALVCAQADFHFASRLSFGAFAHQIHHTTCTRRAIQIGIGAFDDFHAFHAVGFRQPHKKAIGSRWGAIDGGRGIKAADFEPIHFVIGAIHIGQHACLVGNGFVDFVDGVFIHIAALNHIGRTGIVEFDATDFASRAHHGDGFEFGIGFGRVGHFIGSLYLAVSEQYGSAEQCQMEFGKFGIRHKGLSLRGLK